jgi:uncharacterized protein (DUF1501 family)
MPRDPFKKGCEEFRSTRRPMLNPEMSRRQVLMGGLGLGSSLYATKAMTVERMLESAQAQAAAAPNAPILVNVFLPGGCDLLSTLTPLWVAGPLNDVRKTLGDNTTPALGSTGLGLHASLSEGAGGGVRGMFEAGKIGFLPGIDYANPDLSHFNSRNFWETGIVSPLAGPGWLGRWLDVAGSPDNPLQGLTLGGGLSPILRTAGAPVASLNSPRDARLNFAGTWGVGADKAAEAWGRLADAASSSRPGPAASAKAAGLTRTVADKLAPYAAEEGNGPHPPDPLAPPIPYPEDNELGEKLSRAAALLALPLGVRVVTVEADGDYDTHDDQPTELAAALKGLSEALSAFQADIELRGLGPRVLTFVWSEFGRRVESNESQGTDHGAGGVAWVQGVRARPGVLTDYPDITRLDEHGNLAVTVDFRRVYASLLEGWLGTPADAVLPGAATFGHVSLVA